MQGDPGKEMPALRPSRSRLNYANVMSTLAVFIALGGATAFAASHLAKNSVGTRQLKNAAVTTAKIRDGAVGSGQLESGAVSGDKLAGGAVSGDKLAGGAVSADKLAAGAVGTAKLADGGVISAKLADGSVSTQKLAAGILPGPQIVHRSRSTATLEFPTITAHTVSIPYPLEDAIYTQPAGEDDLYVASMQIHVPASCKSSRPAAAHLSIETPGAPTREVIGQGGYSESGNGGDKLATFQFVATELGHGALTAAPVAPLTHTFSIELDGGSCEGKAEVPSHITAVGAQIDVIGFR